MSYINIGDLTGGKQDYWSWANLKNFVGQDEAAEHFYAGESSSVAAYSCFCRLATWSCQGMPSYLPLRHTQQHTYHVMITYTSSHIKAQGLDQ